jgi:transcriptional antiterminator RfaH
VQITAGPFASFVAQIETLAPARRVWVLLDFMGGQTRVEVATDQLRKT